MAQHDVLLAVTDTQHLEAWTSLAIALADGTGIVHVRGLITVGENVSPSEFANQAQQWRGLLDPLAKQNTTIDDDVRVYVEREPIVRLTDDVRDDGIGLALIQWAGPFAPTGGLDTETILESLPCDVVLLCGTSWQDPGSVLLSLRGGPNLTLGTRVAKALSGDASITLFHAADLTLNSPDIEVVMRAEPKITRAVTSRSAIAAGILNEARAHKVIVMGGGLRKPEQRFPRSTVVDTLAQNTDLALALVRTYQPETVAFHAPSRLSPAALDFSTRVDRWFAENTFHSAEFEDIDNLLALKEKRGVTISLGLPALNEEETVENVIRTLKTALMDDKPLLDEIVLIDSDSTDNTVSLAVGAGVPVYRHSQILPQIGTYRGKGEALWKSLAVLKGDIIAWVDTDITNIHPRFVYGLIGPLLKYPRLQYTKGFYQRPIQVGDKLQAYGGGRVTELMARPMFNLFYPEISGFIQPLSGEYAGRREALERVPFFTGYGVETGLLIDLFNLYGLEALAQVDLEVRVHHNQPLVGLSKMSFAILQVFMARLEGKTGVQLVDIANRSMKLVVQEPERFALDMEQIGDVERPPMRSVLSTEAGTDGAVPAPGLQAGKPLL